LSGIFNIILKRSSTVAYCLWVLKDPMVNDDNEQEYLCYMKIWILTVLMLHFSGVVAVMEKYLILAHLSNSTVYVGFKYKFHAYYH
jgi:hypothetical protein